MMAIAKRLPTLIQSFRYQSFFLSLATFLAARHENSVELLCVSILLFLLKVIAIPHLLLRIVRRIKANENIGLFINTQLSLVCALVFTYVSWAFSRQTLPAAGETQSFMFTVALSVILTGGFLMIFRMKALTQIIGLLVMENGAFLLAALVSGGMPFFVEISIFFDVLISMIILGIFVYKINKLFTHIDVHKLTELKG